MPSIITSMKSKFAKFVDMTLGAALVFLAATAIFRYFTTLTLSLFAAGSVTACLFIMFGFSSRRRGERYKISKAADDMFYAFMFKPDNSPAKLLAAGLKQKGVDACVHGDAVYTKTTAAFFAFNAPASAKQTARMISRAKHYGVRNIVILCKEPPDAVDVDGFSVRAVCGDDVYKLFASLGVSPHCDYKKSKHSVRLAAALSPDRMPRYAMLAAALFGISALTGFSVAISVCAVTATLLFIATAIAAIAKAAGNRKKSNG